MHAISFENKNGNSYTQCTRWAAQCKEFDGNDECVSAATVLHLASLYTCMSGTRTKEQL